MTRAVIYARYSTDKQTESSIADQVRVCQDYAETHGMTVTETFADEGISGAALGNRPGVGKLMETALAGQLEAVIVADLSRLSRSMADLPKMIDRLVVRGVKVFGVQDGYDSTRKGHKLQAGLQGIIGEQFRDMISERTFSAMESRAREGVSTGAKCYGYTTEPIDPNDPNSRKRTVTVPNQAKIVREIFERYAEGMTQFAIAQDLNRRGVPSPGSTWKRQSRRCNGWMASGIRVIVNNIRYTGMIRWNTSKWVKDPDTGKRKRFARPRSEWKEYQDEPLRIVSDELFEKVQRRSRDTSNPDRRLKRGGKTKYLLSGLLKCAKCGANYVLTGKVHYQCSGKLGGACDNRISVRRDQVEENILGPIVEDLLAPDRVQAMAKDIEAQVREHYKALQEKATPAELEKIDARIGLLREKLDEGDPLLEPDEIAAALEIAGRKRQEIVDATPAARQSAKILTAVPKAARDYRQQIAKGLEGDAREAAKARIILRDLLGPVELCPGEDGSLWAEYRTRPAALVKKAVGAGSGLSGSGGAL